MPSRNTTVYLPCGRRLRCRCSLGTAQGATIPFDLSTWSVVQYEFNDQPDANWVLSSGNTVASQTVNADASILKGGSVAGTQIQGSWRVNTSSDDDFMGFVFGYQNRGQFYLFDWKQGDQSDPLGFAQAGMSVKVVNTGGSDPTDADLWPTAGSTSVDVLAHNTIPWDEFVDYTFRLNFTPGTFEIEVKQGATVLENWILNDNTYLDGEFGFYNYSQGDVVYSGFTQQDDPPPIGVPDGGSTLLLSSIAFSPVLRLYRRSGSR